ncbi:hypothetical protein EJ066_21910 [Mesorhizobium sp. M9A.F.Ca.ET.002.03.1.2]|uniref:hypothetical protein n=1 Tax=Mesorhizobium sp. M9A.F.Ca.ET.002.03.1.2 TaxID=2493668 RepID=UPI000F75A2CC|nr:hypothetical protein [Mesorhizobium sp. M9A.F.Ca.ET.002.03.1.2]AZN99563.1 hypothetical protein EJ066_21910 [Mesorhizobium sp. M9A.F.Ca.ET.002.03.1.2]
MLGNADLMAGDAGFMQRPLADQVLRGELVAPDDDAVAALQRRLHSIDAAKADTRLPAQPREFARQQHDAAMARVATSAKERPGLRFGGAANDARYALDEPGKVLAGMLAEPGPGLDVAKVSPIPARDDDRDQNIQEEQQRIAKIFLPHDPRLFFRHGAPGIKHDIFVGLVDEDALRYLYLEVFVGGFLIGQLPLRISKNLQDFAPATKRRGRLNAGAARSNARANSPDGTKRSCCEALRVTQRQILNPDLDPGGAILQQEHGLKPNIAL